MVFMYIFKKCWFFLVIFEDVFIFRGEEFKLIKINVCMLLWDY